jgi:hypothetical protein
LCYDFPRGENYSANMETDGKKRESHAARW